MFTRRVLGAAVLVAAVGRCAWAGPVELQATPFPLTEVKLLDGPFKQAQDLDGKYILSLEPDRLLHNFRAQAGLPSNARPLGGWEHPECELRGHFVGHYLSALALMYQTTGDAVYKGRADLMVAELAKCQAKLGRGYLSAFPESLFDRLEAGRGVWAPYYTIHKIMAGLLDVNQLCGNAQALQVAEGMAKYFQERCDKLSDAQMAVVMKTEFGGMMEVLANLYAVTHNPDDLALAKRFDDHRVFDPLAARQDRLAGLHANTQIPKMIGAARLYELTGEPRYHDIADYFWTEVTVKRSFVTGSNSFGEMFAPWGVESKDLVPNTAESCNTYNMLKLTRHEFEANPSVAYADYYERALYNHILGSIDPDTGMTMYYLSLKPGHFKVYGTPVDSFWCCTGTGVENHAKHGDGIYFHNDSPPSLWVNLFIPSVLNWQEKGLAVRQETAFPDEGKTTLTFKAATPTALAVNVRVPYWVTGTPAIRVNGRLQSIKAEAGTYASIARTWNDGDKLEVDLPMGLHVYHAADDADAVALMYGPVVLAGELGRDQFPASDHARDPNALNNTPTPRVPVLVAGRDAGDVSRWVKPVPGKPLTFTTVGVGRPNDITLVPLFAVHHERYTVYWKLTDEAGWDKLHRRWEGEDARKQADAARLVDEAGFGDPAAEQRHHVKGQHSQTGEFTDRYYRDAYDGGSFSCELKVLPDVPQQLRCTYWGSDQGGREFDVLVNGQKVGTQALNLEKPGAFFDVIYPLTPGLLKGQTNGHLTVKFQAHVGRTAGGVFGCAVLRTAE